MNLTDWANELVKGECLKSKLLCVSECSESRFSKKQTRLQIDLPGRERRLKFSEKKLKFPKKNSFHLNEKKALALHSFANHELLAIEMMALALIKFPHQTTEEKELKMAIVSTIEDEQKHLKLYIHRLNELGFELGDFPLNDYFWRRMNGLETIQEFLASMSLTFESANLDFSLYYSKIFLEHGDNKTANIMDVVFRDEIKHVALGAHYLNLWKRERSLWDYYQEILPFPLTPARAKGTFFDRGSREKAGLPQDFVNKLENYIGDFQITNRRQW